MARMQASLLADGRLHLNDGPIDLVIFADGAPQDAARAFEAAVARFSTVLDELCSELPLLRAACNSESPRPSGAIARRMDRATRPLGDARFITRIAAVAGSVADEILAIMLRSAPLRRAYVNNGGDIALHVAQDTSLNVGIVDDPQAPTLFGASTLKSWHRVRGVATSGWRGRSFSFGIADAATVLAGDAARADAAATLIANAIDLPGHPGIMRMPADEIDPQSDLGARPVTRAVAELSGDEIDAALANGAAEAQRLIDEGAIVAASLRLQGRMRIAGFLPPAPLATGEPALSTTYTAPPRREDRTWQLTSAKS